MKKLLLIFSILCICTVGSNAQLKYRSNGKLTMGNVEPVGYYTTHLFGWGHYYSWVGNGYDTFMKICLGVASPRISGTGDQIVFYNSETSQYNSIQVKSVYNYSDARAKTNIVPLRNAIDKVLSLNPVTYNWKDPGMSVRKSAAGGELGEVGFLAQEVELVLPEAVTEDEEGNKLINYSAIIPLLTESMKELTGQIEALNKEVDDLRAAKSTSGIESEMIKDANKPILYQNTPNPFGTETTIKYYIPKGRQSASICVFNLQGSMLLKKPITTGVGEGQITLSASDLKSGIYLYTLLIDNKEVDTKRMLITTN
ncbi:putative secreted protein (Por secretion system target) [Dysgonomonas alginatilytica]|uniref:Putative secreted protein (Por secretion system target) n=1 Tax=Dysgonomonas alginatilytica TaxID=1605892 RepID=A0A2V3PNJ4_9BACT|nr:tail fiber domain-containing protein [Dysgonomonas alginatilytica]PXV62358.1 putative secreted protein (Por secretion system target) [Dysgonomonas alginatilytica]